MSIDRFSAHLVRLEIFQGLSALQISEIVRRAERVIYKPGQPLIADGEPGDAAVLVIDGIAVRTRAPFEQGTDEPVEPGSLLGEMAMLIDTEYSSTIAAVSQVRALRIPRQAMLEIMVDDPSMAEHFVAKVAQRLQRMAARLRGIDDMLAEADRGLVDMAQAGLAPPQQHTGAGA